MQLSENYDENKRVQMFIVAFITLMALIMGGVLVFEVLNLAQVHANKIEPVASVPVSTPAPSSTSQSADLLKEVQAELMLLVKNDGPRAAMDRLEERMAENPEIARYCHGLVHEIGNTALSKYEDFGAAMEYQNDLCGSGYLHGLIEAKFAMSKDVFADMKTICEPKNERSCFHGVGHGLMYYTSNQMDDSLAYCDKYTNNEAIIGCAEGVFMENFNTNTKLHPSAFLNPEDPFYPCSDQKSLYKSVCYFYAPSYYLQLHPNAYEDALGWCTTAEKGYANTCARGVGSRIVKENIANITFAEDICMGGKDLINSCLDGMVSYYMVHFASVVKGRELCTMLSEQNQANCNAAVDSRTGWYES